MAWIYCVQDMGAVERREVAVVVLGSCGDGDVDVDSDHLCRG